MWNKRGTFSLVHPSLLVCLDSVVDEIEDFTSDEEVLPPKPMKRDREVITIDTEPEVIVLDDEDTTTPQSGFCVLPLYQFCRLGIKSGQN